MDACRVVLGPGCSTLLSMAQVTTGLRSVLSNPRVYDTFQRVVGSQRARDEFVGSYIRPEPGLQVLDVGCGPGRLATWIPQVDYTGIDLSEAYIDSAKQTYGHLGRFFVGKADDIPADDLGTFDVVIAKGLLHHLDEPEILELFDSTRGLLNPGGRLVTLDATFTPDMSRAARWVVSRDRGQSVLTPDGYRDLAERYFAKVRIGVHHNLLNIPYSHALMELSAPR